MKRATLSRLLICVLPCVIGTSIAAAPIALAQANPPAKAAASPLAFDVASIRPTDPKTQSWHLDYSVDGFEAQKVTLRMLIKEAYAAYEDGRIVGGPSWLDTDHFDIRARLDPAEIPTYKDLTLDQRRQMLRALLVERFQLVIHSEQRPFPVFALRIAKGGPKLEESHEEETLFDGVKGYYAHITHMHRGLIEGKNFSMQDLADILGPTAQRIIVDQTGLKDRYDILLHWTPLDASGNPIESASATALGTSWPLFFPALEQELGLKLESTKSMIEVFVIDHAEPPSNN